VKLHRNAKTTPAQRLLIVRRYQEEGWELASVAEATGVSERTVWKWIRRFREEGESGLEDRSSTPRRIPHRTPQRRVNRIRRLRAKRLVAWQIAKLMQMARSTVSAVLTRIGLQRMSLLDPKKPAVRYERACPGELVHVDTKKLGRIRGIGKRIHGDRGVRWRGAGWEFVHVCVDDYTRLAYVEVLEDETGPTAAAFLERAVHWFASLGVRVERVLSDNGSCYKKVFDEACARLGVRHRLTRPYRPQTNGKAERFIQTLLRGWAYAKPYRTSGWRRRALQPWVSFYNNVRPHGSLGGRPPVTRVPGLG